MSKHGLAAQIIASFALGDIESTSLSKKTKKSLMTLLAMNMQSCHNSYEVEVLFGESTLILSYLLCRKKQKTSRLGCSHFETVGEMSYCEDCFEVGSS